MLHNIVAGRYAPIKTARVSVFSVEGCRKLFSTHTEEIIVNVKKEGGAQRLPKGVSSSFGVEYRSNKPFSCAKQVEKAILSVGSKIAPPPKFF